MSFLDSCVGVGGGLGKNKYFDAGNFKGTVVKFTEQPSQKNRAVSLVILEILVTQSTNPEVRVGESYSYVWKSIYESIRQEVNYVMCQLAGMDHNSLTREVAERLTSAENPAYGTPVSIDCRLTLTKAGHPFLYVERFARDENPEAPVPEYNGKVKADYEAPQAPQAPQYPQFPQGNPQGNPQFPQGNYGNPQEVKVTNSGPSFFGGR